MGRAKCSNCVYCIKPKNGNLLCTLAQKPTNADGCCYHYDECAGLTALKLFAVVFGLVAAIVMVGLYMHYNYGC